MNDKTSDKKYKVTLTENQLALVGTAVEGMMNDLISRKEAIDAIMGEPTDAHYPSWYAERLEQLPPAQPEIIRCKDCRHNGSFDTDCPIDWNGKEYCSFAER